ncbi:N-Acetylneuraminate cytidylyltransferase [Helicobacter heilmannii]|uniref:pseudaminic acid cytidylyltransferase n=1 Tax=Helicobacter heilmannii TaxID=35817 RepID=UPI0006A040AA|nr:pseudaminic acid cytidylyltransferase [Helicobacter heilmannii]CRF51169.1 N-Acetylneuraminate cytidylyltransferase [Helicobacter heilmannii]
MIALILARGGSKRIPLKNIAPFLGKPLLSYVVQMARSCPLFRQVFVSTDHPKIAKVAKDSGASVLERPARLAGDFNTTLEVAQDAALVLKLEPTTYLCVLYATSVLLKPAYIKNALHALQTHQHKKYAFVCSAYSTSPYRSFSIQENTPTPLFKNCMQQRSQDLPPLYHDAGLFYLGQAKHFIAKEPLLAPHSYPLILPQTCVQDIDSLEDLKLAALKYTAYHENDSPLC